MSDYYHNIEEELSFGIVRTDRVLKHVRHQRDRIEELEELLKAAIDDAKEAEAYAEQLENVLIRKKAKLSKSEALLAKAVELALTKAVVNLRTYAPCLVDGPEHDVGYYHGYHTALNRILDTIAELSSTTKGQGDE